MQRFSQYVVSNMCEQLILWAMRLSVNINLRNTISHSYAVRLGQKHAISKYRVSMLHH